MTASARSRLGLWVAALGTTIVTATGMATANAAESPPPVKQSITQQPTATGSGGAVASDDVQATQAGIDVLRHGGNAVDAAVAVAAVLGVTDPFVAGIGGGGFLAYYDARTRHVYTIDGRETTPASATSSLFIDPSTGQPLSFPTAVTSGLSIGVPGNLMTWKQALDHWGTISLAQALEPAEKTAEQGFPVTAEFREQDRENAFRFDLRHMSQVQALHHYLEATRLAFADRNRYIGDPAYVDVPEQQLLSESFGRQRACLINPDHALTSPVAPGDPYAGSAGCVPAGTAERGQTTDGTSTNHFVVADKWGDVVSYTSTIEEIGGSGIVVPGRGFLLNNELTDFDFAPLQAGVPDPNLPAGGKRPRSSMAPTIVLRDGRPFLAVGSPGGASIITTVLQILLNRLDFGMTLPEAIAAPRASQRNSAVSQAEPAFIALPVTAGLEALGQQFAISDTSPLNPSIIISPDIGAASGLEFLGHGRVLVAAEPVRRDGGSAAVVDPG